MFLITIPLENNGAGGAGEVLIVLIVLIVLDKSLFHRSTKIRGKLSICGKKTMTNFNAMGIHSKDETVTYLLILVLMLSILLMVGYDASFLC